MPFQKDFRKAIKNNHISIMIFVCHWSSSFFTLLKIFNLGALLIIFSIIVYTSFHLFNDLTFQLKIQFVPGLITINKHCVWTAILRSTNTKFVFISSITYKGKEGCFFWLNILNSVAYVAYSYESIWCCLPSLYFFLNMASFDSSWCYSYLNIYGQGVKH